MHWLINTYILLLVGFHAEGLIGKARLLTLYFVSGVMGGLLSAWWHTRHYVNSYSSFGTISEQLQFVVAIGASGAILGLAGGFLVWLLFAEMYRFEGAPETIPKGSLLQIVILTLASGMFYKGVDNAGHIGGLLGGFAVGLVLSLPIFEKKIKWRAAMAVTLATATGAFAVWACSQPLNEDVRELREFARQDMVDLINERKKRTQEQERVESEAKAIEEQETAIAKALETLMADDARLIGMPVPDSVAEGQVLDLGLGGGHAAAMSPDGRYLLIGGEDRSAVRLVDLQTMTNVTDIAPGLSGKDATFCELGCKAKLGTRGIAYAPDGLRAYVSDSGHRRVLVVDIASRRITSSFPAGERPGPIAIDREGKLGYVLNIVDNTVTVFDVQSNRVVTPSKTVGPKKAKGPFFDPNFFRPVYLQAVEDAVLAFDELTLQFYAVDPAHEKEHINFRQRKLFAAMADAKGSIWMLTEDGGILAFDRKTSEEKSFAGRCGLLFSNQLAVTSDGRWIAIDGSSGHKVHAVSLINPITSRAIAEYPLPGRPSAILFSPDNARIYAVNTDEELIKDNFVPHSYLSVLTVNRAKKPGGARCPNM